MEYEELKPRIEAAKTSKQVADLIELLKDTNNRPYPDIKKLKREYDPDGHDVMDESIRKDKILSTPKKDTFKTVKGAAPAPGQAPVPAGYEQGGRDGNNIMVPAGVELVTRIALPFQQEIVESRVDFAFGIPVKLECAPKDENEKSVLDVITKIRKAVKIERIDRESAREAHRATRVAVLWGVTAAEEHERYGIPAKWKFRCLVLKPWDGNDIYPFYDDMGDMIAFCRAYTIKDIAGKDEMWFECYTQDFKYVWRNGQAGNKKEWVLEGAPVANVFKKIPVVYMEFEQTPWHKVKTSIARLETMLSDLGDTNMYHASPKIFVKGKIQSFMKKGEAGGILQGDKDTTAEYMAWNNMPESVKLEAEFCYRTIFGMTRTPDMTFEQMAKMSNPSGETMKMLFMAAHLQTLADSEKYNDFQDRQISLLKSMIAFFFKDLAQAANKIEIEPKITPFVIDDETSRITNLMSANGNKPLMSQETSMNMYGKIPNVQEELERMAGQQEADDEREISKEKQLQTSPANF